MNISLYNLSKVGCVGATYFANVGSVVGVDVNQNKVDLMNAGKPAIIESILLLFYC